MSPPKFPSDSNPVPGPRPPIAYPNPAFEQICFATVNLWRIRESRANDTPEGQRIGSLTNQLVLSGVITLEQGTAMLNAVNALERFDWINNDLYAWQDAWHVLCNTIGDAGCPRQYFVHFDEDLLP